MESVTRSLLLIRRGLKRYAIFKFFFWLNLAYKYTEVCICFANHESLREVWTVCLLFLLWFRFLLAGINNAKEKTSHIYWYNVADHVLWSGVVRQFSFLFYLFQPEKKWLRQNPLRGHEYQLILTALFNFQTQILEYSCR